MESRPRGSPVTPVTGPALDGVGVLVTGGAGYIGSHTLIELAAAGCRITVIDNFCNSSPAMLRRVEEIAGVPIGLEELDLRDPGATRRAVERVRPQAVIHFAGLKAVGEGEAHPLLYHQANVGGTLNLLTGMEAAGCGRLVFSSSATVYGLPRYLPYDEAHPLDPVSVYGRTKWLAEAIIRDWGRSGGGQSDGGQSDGGDTGPGDTGAKDTGPGDLGSSDQGSSDRGPNDRSPGDRSPGKAERPAGRAALLLRYFNPVGAHASGRLGEDPLGPPNNLMPFLAQVAIGRREHLEIFGDDYPTPDGTGVRDYIHVTDLARAHVAALGHLMGASGVEALNIGSGRGHSVREMHAAFSAAVGRPLPVRIAPRRAGDIAEMRADPGRAERLLGWRAELGLAEMCQSAWNWQSRHPDGLRAEAGDGAATGSEEAGAVERTC